MHHFQLAESNKGGQPKNYFETINKGEYSYKGDPNKIRGTMAQEVKDDLRASHFRVGFENKT